MSFKRKTAVQTAPIELPKGVRLSPKDGRWITSSGSTSFDYYLLGGIPLRSLLVVEEDSTDYSSVLLKFFAAEGFLQDHAVWLGPSMGEPWFRQLPAENERAAKSEGMKSSGPSPSSNTAQQNRMKIAWRYENTSKTKVPAPDAIPPGFTHAFDLTKRLTISSNMMKAVSPFPLEIGSNPFIPVLESLTKFLASLKPGTVCRLVLPSLLSPAFYSIRATHPQYFIRFIHSLSSLIKCTTSVHIVCMCSVPSTLFSRDCEQVYWLESLASGVFSLHPFPITETVNGLATQPQGLFRIHKLPLPLPFTNTDNSSEAGDLSFTVSKRRFTIEPWVLPPLDEEQPEAKPSNSDNSQPSLKSIEF
ncbi:elongator complex subunit Elp4 [Schizosaccharomyces osmophilus]|uniref:Elongator complex protein 4 n=1 Tax=Schizosaccharomyces osmophilus TaxID=2545709 RepID=A0AAE9WEG6_9SCHI|nr:elongator complex subunit Elp4 [Schizosaccharomyces osmophilus]WBW74789.1 elongator complex subunit Elp4 [Schizosaccharomyces osmophilus]